MFSFLHIALFLKIADAKMEEIARQLADCQLNDEAPTPEEQVELRKRYIEVLVHACACRNASCPELPRTLNCPQMKSIVAHTKVCPERKDGTCPVCNQIIALCCWHAKQCEVAECKVPFCLHLRGWIAAQKAAAAAAANG